VKAAVLQTFRKDGSPLVTPVWFRERDGAYEVVIAEGDVKLAHLRRDPRCIFVAFDTEPPFAGLAITGEAELVECDVTPMRAEIASRYLGAAAGARFAEQRRSKPGVLVSLTGERREWDLSNLLQET